MRSCISRTGQTFYYLGKDLSEGPLPAVFFFALSAEESLLTDPFNQAVEILKERPIRIFSIDLPAHGAGHKAVDAIKVWSEELSSGIDPLTPFLDATARSIESFLEEGILLPDQVAVMGLSRGAFVALEIGARVPFIKNILGFAPLIQLSQAKEIKPLSQNPLVQGLDVNNKIADLIDKKIRLYISNRDTRVSTKVCFDFVYTLAETAHTHNIRSPHIELLLTPPIGHQGHGTARAVFEEGALWLLHLWNLV